MSVSSWHREVGGFPTVDLEKWNSLFMKVDLVTGSDPRMVVSLETTHECYTVRVTTDENIGDKQIRCDVEKKKKCFAILG